MPSGANWPCQHGFTILSWARLWEVERVLPALDQLTEVAGLDAPRSPGVSGHPGRYFSVMNSWFVPRDLSVSNTDEAPTLKGREHFVA